MATNVAIANLALARLGDSATVSSLSPPEGSPQAEHCAMFLPIARDVLLEMHPWKFATARALLAPLDAATYANTAWAYAYAEPADCIAVLSVLPEGYTADADDTAPFTTETAADGQAVILSNAANLTVRYIRRVVDPARYTPLFTEALVWLLASYIAGPILKGDEGMKAAQMAWGSFLLMFARATGSSARQAKIRTEHLPEGIAIRA